MSSGSKAKRGGDDQITAFAGKFSEAFTVGAEFIWFIDQQFAAWQVTFEANQCVCVIDQQHAVTKVGKMIRALSGMGEVAKISQKFHQNRVMLAKWFGVTDNDQQAVRLSALDDFPQFCHARRRFQFELREVFIVGTDFLPGDAQQTVDCRLVVTPGSNQFARHGNQFSRLLEFALFPELTVAIGIIESLDHEARGITRQDGKAVFVDGGLPGETVEYASFRRKPSYELAHLVRVLKPSSARVVPGCKHFGICGGCTMQHLEHTAQLAAKQRILEDSLWHIGRVRSEHVLAPIQGTPWGYRQRARLAVRKIPGAGGMLIGFHERRSSYIADIQTCAVLPPHVSDLLMPLRALFGALSVADRLPQIEIAVGEKCTALLLRLLMPLSGKDEKCLRDFADRHDVVFYLQPRGPDSIRRFYPLAGPRLSYLLPEFDLEFDFLPNDFTQVNHAVNRVLVRTAIRLLDPQPGESIVDMFSGLGNFTLPIARSGAVVLGVEGSEALIRRGRDSAQANGLADRVTFAVANLFECTEATLARLGRFDKMLIDPPREGALELVKAIGSDAPHRIVYVSCNPSTLARDAAILVNLKAYRFVAAGAVNMFPHTSHVESIAVFERP